MKWRAVARKRCLCSTKTHEIAGCIPIAVVQTTSTMFHIMHFMPKLWNLSLSSLTAAQPTVSGRKLQPFDEKKRGRPQYRDMLQWREHAHGNNSGVPHCVKCSSRRSKPGAPNYESPDSLSHLSFSLSSPQSLTYSFPPPLHRRRPRRPLHLHRRRR